MRPKTRTLTDQELEIMKVVWDLKRGTVRQVYETLLQRKQVAYTTVMTMMNILESKGHLEKERDGRAYCYTPVRPKNQVIGTMIDDFVDRVFNGSARPLLLSLVRDRKLSHEDLEAIRQHIEESEDQ